MRTNLVLLVLVSVTLVSISGELRCLEQSFEGFGGVFPSINSPSEYMRCLEGVVHTIPCLEGHYFDVETQTCLLGHADNQPQMVAAFQFEELCNNPDVVEIFPNPTNCSQYILCYGTVPIVQTCSEELLFNPQLNSCDLPGNVVCGYSCPAVDDPYNPVWLPDARLEDCARHYLCFKGDALPFFCYNNLYFDIVTQTCTFPQYSACRVPNVYCTTNVTTNVENPRSCTSYYICEDGFPHFRTCGFNEYFSVQLGRCVPGACPPDTTTTVGPTEPSSTAVPTETTSTLASTTDLNTQTTDFTSTTESMSPTPPIESTTITESTTSTVEITTSSETVTATTIDSSTMTPTTGETSTFSPTTPELTTSGEITTASTPDTSTASPTAPETSTFAPTTPELTTSSETTTPGTPDTSTASPTTPETSTPELTTSSEPVTPSTIDTSTASPTTDEPSTFSPTTPELTTSIEISTPSTVDTSTASPTTDEPSTFSPTTPELTTSIEISTPSTVDTSTEAPTTLETSTLEPTTAELTTVTDEPSTTTLDPITTTEMVPIDPNEACAGLGIIILPYPGNCLMYIICLNGIGGIAACGTNEIFNPGLQSCVPGNPETCTPA